LKEKGRLRFYICFCSRKKEKKKNKIRKEKTVREANKTIM